MSNIIKKDFVLEGLDCASCAMKIEAHVSKIENVYSASMNFATKTLTIQANIDSNIKSLLRNVNEIIQKIEPGVLAEEIQTSSKPEKKILILEGLGCANCAGKIESAVKNVEGVKDASVDFVTKKLTIEVFHKKELLRIIEEASIIAEKIEDGVKVIPYEKDRRLTEERGLKKAELIRLGIGILLFAVALIFKFTFYIELGIFLASYLLIGGEVLLKAVKNIMRGQVFDENFLMSLATVGAFSIQQFPEGVAVMLFYQVGEFFQNLAVNHSRRSISALMDIRPDYANLKHGDSFERVSPEQVSVGDIILIKPGEKVPLDGKVIEGMSALDTAAITGESLPREIEPGQEILSGAININGLLTVEVTREFGESTVSKILDLVQNASSKKAPTENFITKFARYYTPAVVFIALAIAIVPPFAIPGATFSDWIYRALVFLVVSCPCALVISIPLSFFGGIGGASKHGILMKGSNYLEALNNVDTVVFDKTGTLTKGVFKVTKVFNMIDSEVDSKGLLEIAAYAESFSTHPIALSITKEYGKVIDTKQLEQYDEIPGHGIKVKWRGVEIIAGNSKLMNKEDIAFPKANEIGTIVHIARSQKYLGYLVIADELKGDAQSAISQLRKIGVNKLVMLTGDSKTVGDEIGKFLGLDEVHSELLPGQKVDKLELLETQKKTKGKLIFVGDGINDAPVLTRADIGIAMGGLGSDAAIEAADVVIMTDEPSKISSAIRIAKRTQRIVWQNIIFAFAVKGVVLILGAGGLATMWEAVFADVGVAIIAIFNAMRVLNAKNI